MDEKKLIEHANSYLKLLSEGINPVDKTRIEDSSILKNEKIKRCLDYSGSVFTRITESKDIVKGDYRIPFSPAVKREQDVLRRAAYIINKLMLGFDPFTNKKTPVNDTVNSARISKCLEYTEYVLTHTTLQKLPFAADEALLEQTAYSDERISLNEFADRLNKQIDTEAMTSIYVDRVVSYLIGIQLADLSDSVVKPTKLGSQLGLSAGTAGELLVSKTMQKLIVRNMEAISKQTEGQ